MICTPTTVVQGYGMTELTSAIIHVPGGRHDESGSVGLLNPNCDCRILDEDGNPVSPGPPGELYVRGPNICPGYWKNEQATKEMLDQEDWLKTGDVVVLRDDLFWVVDRKKEPGKVNSPQVSPAELEAVLLEHDGIADAGVVGITIQGQEWPRAYVRPTEDKVGALSEVQAQEYVKRNVAKHKQLVGGVKFVNDVPRLASGKIQRSKSSGNGLSRMHSGRMQSSRLLPLLS
ncbi:hypothetical protein MPDQ_007311 [Monascus purpureus]|uniref:AMP-dependent synthetase/ligase domain-containing protein n=1 Tax=Monascus purpureus TaxID=5098 RepID=A0A507QUA4_MONPU|nr:hypothetical protein MPDQ_007311 [Monascus purpureus]BDD62601.1 hypothetical protein MAP00_007566 [Monascus purpureus]